MEPIINPMWFYLISVFSGILGICSIILFIGGIFTLISSGVALFYYYSELDYMSEDGKKNFMKVFGYIKKFIIVLIITAVVAIVTPSRETMYYMIASSYVTEDNIGKATEVIKDSVDYIFEKFEGDND